MSHTEIIEAAADLTLVGEDARKVEYVVGQYLYGNREDADLRVLSEAIRPLVRKAGLL